MSNLFAGVYGARFPEVVMNSGPLPPEGGLPAPLHDTPDSRINYGSTLLGDLQPYAYGEAGYMSSQSQNNQPHRIQKIIPLLHLPEPNGLDTFSLSHAVDDSDLAFVMRLNRHSVFCTGTRGGTRRNTKVGTTVDPIINLPTLNYLLAGLQLSKPDARQESNLWWEFLLNLDPGYWNSQRNYSTETRKFRLENPDMGISEELEDFKHEPFTLQDIIHIIRHCIKPFGIVRGSEKQGGQHEMGNSPAVWTAPTIATLVIDGKEANVVNIWHYHDLHAGEDIVLRLRPMPVRTYTLNHYFKGFARKSFEVPSDSLVWQLVPDVLTMEMPGDESDDLKKRLGKTKNMTDEQLKVRAMALSMIKTAPSVTNYALKTVQGASDFTTPRYESAFQEKGKYNTSWHQWGFWHIGRTQVMRAKYGTEEFYHNDMANGLKTNHIDMTFQPTFSCLPRLPSFSGFIGFKSSALAYTLVAKQQTQRSCAWTPTLRIEQMHGTFQCDPFSSFEKTLDSDIFDPPFKRAALSHASDRCKSVSFSTAADPFTQDFANDEDFCLKSFSDPFSEIHPFSTSIAAGPDQPLPEETVQTLTEESVTETVEDPPATVSEPLSEESRQELLGGLGAAPKKNGRGSSKKRGPVEGTLLRPGADPEPCRMELL